MDKLLRRHHVEGLTTLSRSTIYRMVADGSFPAPLQISERSVRWRESEIREWLNSRERASGNLSSVGTNVGTGTPVALE